VFSYPDAAPFGVYTFPVWAINFGIKELQNLEAPREKMISYTQDELDSICTKLQDRTECDADGWLNVGEGVHAYMIRDEEVDQTVTFLKVATYGYHSSEGADFCYTRLRPNREAGWGGWGRIA
jgi:hypothetical protein